jgi:ureidoacrylate peracid hydrolase
MDFDQLTTRDVPLVPNKAALLIVDVQNFSAHREGGEFRGLSHAEFESRYGWFFSQIEADTIPKMARLAAACRAAGVEVMYTVIESLTQDGRDRSLDYRITGFHVPRGSWDAKVLDALAPVGDEIVLPKTSSNVFISTNIDYLLRNMGKRQLVVAGFITDQCVSSAVRDACDLGYLVTLPTDACATYSAERHAHAVASLSGYCRQVSTASLIAELGLSAGIPAGLSAANTDAQAHEVISATARTHPER